MVDRAWTVCRLCNITLRCSAEEHIADRHRGEQLEVLNVVDPERVEIRLRLGLLGTPAPPSLRHR